MGGVLQENAFWFKEFPPSPCSIFIGARNNEILVFRLPLNISLRRNRALYQGWHCGWPPSKARVKVERQLIFIPRSRRGLMYRDDLSAGPSRIPSKQSKGTSQRNTGHTDTLSLAISMIPQLILNGTHSLKETSRASYHEIMLARSPFVEFIDGSSRPAVGRPNFIFAISFQSIRSSKGCIITIRNNASSTRFWRPPWPS